MGKQEGKMCKQIMKEGKGLRVLLLPLEGEKKKGKKDSEQVLTCEHGERRRKKREERKREGREEKRGEKRRKEKWEERREEKRKERQRTSVNL